MVSTTPIRAPRSRLPSGLRCRRRISVPWGSAGATGVGEASLMRARVRGRGPEAPAGSARRVGLHLAQGAWAQNIAVASDRARRPATHDGTTQVLLTSY